MSVHIFRDGESVSTVDEIDVVGGSLDAVLAATGDRVTLIHHHAELLGTGTVAAAAVDGEWTTINANADAMAAVEDGDSIEIDFFATAAADAKRFTVQMTGRMFRSLPLLAAAPTGTDAPDGILEQRVPRLFEASSSQFSHSQAYIGRDATHIYVAHSHAASIQSAVLRAYRNP